MYCGADSGVYRSEDSGEHWERLDSTMNEIPIWALADTIIEVARHDVVEAEELDIRVDPERDAGAVRPAQRRAAVDRDIGEGTVAARCHARAPEGGGGLFAIK
jgi:hypothetical protein